MAVLKEKAVVSPLDQLLKRQGMQAAGLAGPSVGRMRLEVRLRPPLATHVPTADVMITIISNTQAIDLPGVVVQEARPGWITLDVPPTETWEPMLQRLPTRQRERVESAEFYETLQRHVGQRFLALTKTG